jgi:hypothetical protein
VDIAPHSLFFLDFVENAPDAQIWNVFYGLVIKSTLPARLLPHLDQTAYSFNTSSFANTSENRKDEVGSSLYVDVPSFLDAFFGGTTTSDYT